MNHGISLEPSASRGMQRNSAELLPVNYREDYRRLLALVFASGEVSYLPYQSEDGSWREIRIVPHCENDEIPAAMVISTDITEKRNLQAQAIHNRTARLHRGYGDRRGPRHQQSQQCDQYSGNTFQSCLGGCTAGVFERTTASRGLLSRGLSFASEERIWGLIAEIRTTPVASRQSSATLKQLGSSRSR